MRGAVAAAAGVCPASGAVRAAKATPLVTRIVLIMWSPPELKRIILQIIRARALENREGFPYNRSGLCRDYLRRVLRQAAGVRYVRARPRSQPLHRAPQRGFRVL